MSDFGALLTPTRHPIAVWLVYLIFTLLIGGVIGMFFLVGLSQIVPEHVGENPIVILVAGVLGGYLALAYLILSQGAPASEPSE